MFGKNGENLPSIGKTGKPRGGEIGVDSGQGGPSSGLGKGGAAMKEQAGFPHGSVRTKKTALARTIGARYQCKYSRGRGVALRPLEPIDSPVIYGVRVETSNPYHLLISSEYSIVPWIA